jgi:hypothetical protein
MLFPTILAVACLAGCTKKEETTTVTEGPYQGISVYDAGEGWGRIAVPPPAQGSRTATLADDDHVIVLINSQTGEVRQCGDLSGYCITFNPWAGPLDASHTAPVTLEPLRDAEGKVIERVVPKKEETIVASPAH